jgi:hypothetical protein
LFSHNIIRFNNLIKVIVTPVNYTRVKITIIYS